MAYLVNTWKSCIRDVKACQNFQMTQLKQRFFEEHRKSFTSGNQISLVSLHDNHDARGKISVDIKNHVQHLLDQGLTRSMIVEIRHSPGTGYSNIARQVLSSSLRPWTKALNRRK